MGDGPYFLLRLSEKSKPVPNMEDPNYSHMHTVQAPTDCHPGEKQEETAATTSATAAGKTKTKTHFKIK